MGRGELQAAFLLHLRPYQNTSALVELFTREHGRIGAVVRQARGSDRRSSQRRGMLQPFMPLLLSWAGRGELKTVMDIEAGGAIALAGERLFAGLYINELTHRLLHRNDPHAGLYESYAHSLENLSAGDDIEPVLRRYEMRLLDELGYGVNLDMEADTGEPLRADAEYGFIPESGLICMSGRNYTGRVFLGKDLQAIAAGDLQGAALKVAKYLCRAALQPLLGNEPLRSRELFVRKSS